MKKNSFWENNAPYLLIPAIMFLALIFVFEPTWITLTLAGLAMGMIYFMMSSGLSIVFGLMDVLNLAHVGFITVGAFIAGSLVGRMYDWSLVEAFLPNVAVVLIASLGGALIALVTGYLVERLLIRPVYGNHLEQILITMGGLIVIEEIVVMIWGSDPVMVERPSFFQGSLLFGDVVVEKYRIFCVVIGLIIYLALRYVLKKTRIGLLIRAGVENREMVEALGYKINFLFTGVFVIGSALAGLGGVLFAFYEEMILVSIGQENLIVVFIVVIIGGLGSITGSFLGALLVGLVGVYVGFFFPVLKVGANLLLMIAILEI